MDTSERPIRRRDAQATKERLLLAAIDEFAAHGLAGARIDEIAERAGANKRLIYSYFGSKDELFDAVLARTLGVLTESVPLVADDLPGWAGRLFDRLVAEPHVLALVTWRNSERAGASAQELESYADKIAAIKAAQRAGVVRSGITPGDLLILVMGMVSSWPLAPVALKQLADGSGPASSRTIRRHRRALVDAVARVVAPS